MRQKTVFGIEMTGFDGYDVMYVLFNNATGREYVGCTGTLHHVLLSHRASLRSGRHWCGQLQEDFDCFGEEALSVPVLFATKGRSGCRAKIHEFHDSYLIERHYGTTEYLYNSHPSTLEILGLFRS